MWWNDYIVQTKSGVRQGGRHSDATRFARRRRYLVAVRLVHRIHGTPIKTFPLIIYCFHKHRAIIFMSESS